MRAITRAAAFAALFFMAAAANAGPHFFGGPHHGGPPMGFFLEKHADALGLDEATRAEIEAIVEASRAEGETLREELRAAHDTMRTLLEADVPDESLVMNQAAVIGELETRRQQHRLRALLRIQEQLTPEQREALRAMHADRRHGKRHWKRMRQACDEDRERLCGDLRGRASFACMADRRAELSEGCRAALAEAHGGRVPGDEADPGGSATGAEDGAE